MVEVCQKIFLKIQKNREEKHGRKVAERIMKDLRRDFDWTIWTRISFISASLSWKLKTSMFSASRAFELASGHSGQCQKLSEFLELFELSWKNFRKKTEKRTSKVQLIQLIQLIQLPSESAWCRAASATSRSVASAAASSNGNSRTRNSVPDTTRLTITWHCQSTIFNRQITEKWQINIIYTLHN